MHPQLPTGPSASTVSVNLTVKSATAHLLEVKEAVFFRVLTIVIRQRAITPFESTHRYLNASVLAIELKLNWWRGGEPITDAVGQLLYATYMQE